MKKHLSIFILLLGILSITGCSSGTKEDTPEIPPQIIISEDILTDGLSFTHEGGEKSVNFSSNQDWTLTVNNNDNWCIPSRTNGSAGSASVSFKISPNDKPEKRKTTITIQAGSINKTFTITQDELPQIIIDEDLINKGISLTNEGGEITIDFSTNLDWELTLDKNESWCVPSQTSGAAGSASVSFKINKNENTVKRKVAVTIQAGSAKKTFTITQDELVAEIIIDNQLIENGIYVSNQVNSPRISFSVNTNWTIAKGDQEWCIPSSNAGAAGDIEITFSILANETYYDRRARIAIEAARVKKVVYITQERKYLLSTTTEHYTKKHTAGNILVNYTCNTECDIRIDVPWIKQVSLENDDSFNHKLTLAIEENKSENDRTATITIANDEKDLKQIITITQKGRSKDEGISPDGNIDNMEWE